ncbi:DUF4365 domain-containing protein [Actinomadura rupiterrae]|uniref:DUF4365 domain-containing protein n=1 Tax=Actinomadura rupiterrae TaxID=559627 RepID=UPI0020A24C2F|nr:DUF4365 domain-containing protein [Actinomadura rupiterrae]MCP2341164.1 hypothetical protein [Actinomadura rupiterrae]
MPEAESWQKEHFSNAYMLAIATRGGCTIGTWNQDKDGVDVTLRRRGLMVDFQLKCTHNPRGAGGDLVYDLDVATYNKLRDPERSAPGYMALVIVPAILDDWILHEPTRLLMACHGYWAKLQDQLPPRGNATTAVRLPRTQALTCESLELMFQVALRRIKTGHDEGEAA